MALRSCTGGRRPLWCRVAPRLAAATAHLRLQGGSLVLGVALSCSVLLEVLLYRKYISQAISAAMEETHGVSVQGSDEAVTGARLGMEEAVTGARLDARLIDTYDGTGDVVEWYTQASLLCEYRGVSVAEVLPMRLKGGAFAVWSQLPAKDRRSQKKN